MSEENNNQLNEPSASYNAEKRITFFSSLQEMDDHKITEMAKLTHEQLLANLDHIRKFILREHLLIDGSWPAISKTITIKKPKTE